MGAYDRRGGDREAGGRSGNDAHGVAPGKRTLAAKLPGAVPGQGGASDAIDRLEERLEAATAACDDLSNAIEQRSFEGAVVWRRSVDTTVQAIGALTAEAEADADEADGDEVALRLRRARERAAPLLGRAARLLAQAPEPAADDASMDFAMGLPGIAEPPGRAERRRRWMTRLGATTPAPTASIEPAIDDLRTGLGLPGVEVHADDSARQRTEARGARGLATGGDIYLHPDTAAAGGSEARVVVAHEMIHEAQAVLPGATGSDRREAEAEASELAQAFAATGAIRTPRVPIDLGERAAADNDAWWQGDTRTPAERYLSWNAREVWHGVYAYLRNVAWPVPHPHFAWGDVQAFVHGVMTQLDHLVDLDKPELLEHTLFPAKPGPVITPLLPASKKVWIPSVGVALGQMFEDAIRASLARLGPRWVSIAEHEADPAGLKDETMSLVRYDQLIKSAPIDREVAYGLTRDGAVALVGATTTESLAANAPRPLRSVQLEWQGGQDASLWNWVRATDPVDATIEEVAASLWHRDEAKYGEPVTFRADLLIAAPPLFAVPPSWARQFRGAREHMPQGDVDETRGARWAALTNSRLSDEIALAQAAPEGAAAPAPNTAGALATMRDSMILVDSLLHRLMPWNLSAPIWSALGWLSRKHIEVATMEPAQLATWAPVLEAQKSRLERAAGGVRQVVEAAPGMGIDKPDSPGASSLVDILKMYANATAVSHLGDTGESLLAEAAAMQQGLAARAVRATMNDMTMVVGQTSSILSAGDRKKAGELAATGEELQQRLARGEAVDSAQLDETTLAAQELAFQGRIDGLTVQVADLEAAAQQAGEGLASHIAAHFHGSFKRLSDALTPIRRTLQEIAETQRLNSQDPGDMLYVEPGEDRAASLRLLRRYELGQAQKALRELQENSDLSTFLREGASIIQWQGFATACVKMIALIGISFVSAGVGSLVGEGVGALLAGSEGAAGVAELSTGARFVAAAARAGATATRFVSTVGTEAALNTVAQVELMGGSYGGTFLENALMTMGGNAILGRIEKDLQVARTVEMRAGGTWAVRAGKFVLKEAGAITMHTVVGTAMGSVAHMIVERKTHAASPMEMRDWLLQGVSVTLGRYAHQLVAGRQPVHDKLAALPDFPEGRQLATSRKELLAIAERAAAQPSGEAAVEVVEARNRMLEDEVAALEAAEKHPDIHNQSTFKPGELSDLEYAARAERAAVRGQGYDQVAIQDADLRPLGDSGVYVGTDAQVERALAAARRMGLSADATKDTTGTWRGSIDGRSIEVHSPSGGDSSAATVPGGGRGHPPGGGDGGSSGGSSASTPDGTTPTRPSQRPIGEASTIDANQLDGQSTHDAPGPSIGRASTLDVNDLNRGSTHDAPPPSRRNSQSTHDADDNYLNRRQGGPAHEQPTAQGGDSAFADEARAPAIPVGRIPNTQATHPDYARRDWPFDGEWMKNAEVESKVPLVEAGHVNDTWIVTLRGPDGRTARGMFKPKSGEGPNLRSNVRAGTYYKREVAASRLNDALGLDLVPTTVTRTIDGEVGSVQLFAEGSVKYRHNQDNVTFDRAAAERLRVFDYIQGNSDRHDGNIHAREAGGETVPVAIDNGLAFPEGVTDDWRLRDRVSPAPREPLLRETIDLIQRLDLESIARVLADSGIEKEAVIHSLRRTLRMMNDPSFLAEGRVKIWVKASVPEQELSAGDLARVDEIVAKLYP